MYRYMRFSALLLKARKIVQDELMLFFIPTIDCVLVLSMGTL